MLLWSWVPRACPFPQQTLLLSSRKNQLGKPFSDKSGSPRVNLVLSECGSPSNLDVSKKLLEIGCSSQPLRAGQTATSHWLVKEGDDGQPHPGSSCANEPGQSSEGGGGVGQCHTGLTENPAQFPRSFLTYRNHRISVNSLLSSSFFPRAS